MSKVKTAPRSLRSLVLGVATAGCALGVVLPSRVAAAVSDEEFNSLSNLVQQLNGRVQDLEQKHGQDQQTHAQDQQEIQQLRRQLGQTQTAVTNAVQTAEAAQLQAQPSGPPARHNFMVVGDAEVQYGKVDGSHGGFAMADFAPIFLFRANDNILFEAGFDVTLQNEGVPLHDGGSGNGDASTAVDLSFAQLDYLFNDYVTVVSGYMLLPLGTYTERSAGWLNKIPDDPLPRSVLPESGVGAQLEGALPIGDSGQMFTWSTYGVNGPGSVDGTANSTTTDADGNTIPNLDLGGNVGFNSDGSTGNLHGSPSGGGRIGWFYPLKPHYDLELGLSGQAGTWDNADAHLWSAVVVDAALHVSPYFEAKGEYINTWAETADAGTIHPRGWWIQAAYKLAGLQLDYPVVNDVELVGRYDTVKDGVGAHTDRYTAGCVYYFTNTLWFEGDYEWLSSNDPAQDNNEYLLQLSYGF